LTVQVSRQTRWRGRRPVGALLALVYLWTFVALGWTHLHASPGAAAACMDQASCTADPTVGIATETVVSPVLGAPDDVPCVVCAAVQVTTVALAQPPDAVRTPAPGCRLAAPSASLAPTRSNLTPHPRGPPQA
jgi:hypothetical protein